jgi:hypothetical protein
VGTGSSNTGVAAAGEVVVVVGIGGDKAAAVADSVDRKQLELAWQFE